MTIQTYKYKSKIATALSFIAAFIVYIGKDELAKILPVEWAYLAPIIVLIAGYIATQTTENKRVDIAEKMILEQLGEKYPLEDNDPAGEYETLNDEYECGEDDGC